MIDEYNLKGNVTTVVKFIVMSVSPALGIGEALQDPLVGVIVGVIFFILAYFDAKYENTLINKDDTVLEEENNKHKDEILEVLYKQECMNNTRDYMDDVVGGGDGESGEDTE